MREAYFHEDNHNQIQLLPISNWDSCLSQIKRITEFSDKNFTGAGWTDIYIREENPQGLASLNIHSIDLFHLLGKNLEPYNKVFTGYSTYKEEVKNTVAFGSITSCIVYAQYDSNSIIEEIWLDIFVDSAKDKEIVLTTLLGLGNIRELFLVDWNLGITVQLQEKEEIISYLESIEKRNADVLQAIQAMRKGFDNQDTK
jgi:hypothetical protein